MWFSSDQFSCSVMSNSLRPHELQHARPPSPSPTPGGHSDSSFIESVMPSSHLILGRPHLFLPLIPPSIRVFPMRQLFAWGDQSTGVSALASFLPKKSQGWSPCSPRDPQESSPTPQFKRRFRYGVIFNTRLKTENNGVGGTIATSPCSPHILPLQCVCVCVSM